MENIHTETVCFKDLRSPWLEKQLEIKSFPMRKVFRVYLSKVLFSHVIIVDLV